MEKARGSQVITTQMKVLQQLLSFMCCTWTTSRKIYREEKSDLFIWIKKNKNKDDLLLVGKLLDVFPFKPVHSESRLIYYKIKTNMARNILITPSERLDEVKSVSLMCHGHSVLWKQTLNKVRLRGRFVSFHAFMFIHKWILLCSVFPNE